MIRVMLVSAVLATMIPPAFAKDLRRDVRERVLELAAESPVARVFWRGRGRAPIGYVKGMALAWAVVYEKWRFGDPAAAIMAMADTARPEADALSWYDGVFVSRDMRNDESGSNTLRHLFVLMYGLGMRESSGRFCEGRDRSVPEHRATGETAESGMFQMSWDARFASREIINQFERYSDEYDDLMEVFREGVECTKSDLKSYGDGEGLLFQERCGKASPMCAILTTGVGLRVVRDHWGPINRRAAEVRQDVNELLRKVQETLDDDQVVAREEADAEWRR